MKVRHRLALAAVATAAAGGAVTAAAAPAMASGSYIYTQPGHSAALATCWQACGSTASFYPANGTSASMICYTDQNTYTGNYSSNRWFIVNIGGHSGEWFIHSSYVYYQTSVPHC